MRDILASNSRPYRPMGATTCRRSRVGALTEKNFSCFLRLAPVALQASAADRLRRFESAFDRGTLADAGVPGFDVRKLVDLDALAIAGENPWPAYHVGDGILPGDEVATLELLVQDAVQTMDLVAVANGAIGDLALIENEARGVVAEMVAL